MRNKILLLICCILLTSTLYGFASPINNQSYFDENGVFIFVWTERAIEAHRVADEARANNAPEDSDVILEMSKIWWEEYYKAEEECKAAMNQVEEKITYTDPVENYTESDIDYIASVIFNEADYGCTDRHRELVAAVICNRVRAWYFPNSVYGVITQAGQYNALYATYGSYYMNRAMASENWDTYREMAKKALDGLVDIDPEVVYQANFKQGSGVYEKGYTSYSITYFCYVDSWLREAW